jgi:hypothetical protein
MGVRPLKSQIGRNTMPRDASNSPGAQALRRAGYVKCPAFWVTQEQYELIRYMAEQNKDIINAIKERTYGAASSTYYQRHDDRS